MDKIFFRIKENINRCKFLFTILLVGTLAVSILGIYAGITFESAALSLDMGNVSFIKFLCGNSGFVGFIFSSFISILVIYAIIILACCKKFTYPIALLFYFYFVYSQMVIFICLITIYGFFNVLILAICVLVFFIFEFLLLALILLDLWCISNSFEYFKCCYNPNYSNVVWLSLILALVVLIFCLTITILKSFVILLIF